MPDPLTDAPAAVVPFVLAEPDWLVLTDDEREAALEVWDNITTPVVRAFEFPPDPANVSGGTFSAFETERIDGLHAIHFVLSVGAAPEDFEDEYVALWILGDGGHLWYQATVQAGAAFVGNLEIDWTGSVSVITQLVRPSAPTVIAPLAVALAMVVGKIKIAEPPDPGPAPAFNANPSPPGVSRPTLLPPS